MPQEQKSSEVVRLLSQIEAECLAARQGLAGYAESAKHAAITARMENLGRLHEDLRAFVGDDAIRLIVDVLENIPTK